MKKIISMMLVVVLALLAVVPTVFAADDQSNEFSFFISIYNDIDQTNPVKNTKITAKSKTTVLQTLDLLKEKKLIVDYSVNNSIITSIELEDKTIETTSSTAGSAAFYTKRTAGKKQTVALVNQVIEDGDIIEWIYGYPAGRVYVPEKTENTTQVQTRPQTTHWTEDAQIAMEDGCEFLTLNQETSDFYIVALGCAGKTADVKKVNSLLSDIRQTKIYDSPTAISRNILSLTFCGYDATELVSQLTSFPNIIKQGIFGAINALVAYDSKQYSVSSTEINSREKLIQTIVSNQRSTGGFGINQAAKDDLDTTAMAMTALSPYSSDSEMKPAIDKAVEFLIKNQTPTGGFGFMGEESSESLSQVIIALSSLEIEIDDARFMNRNKNLLDQLLEYKNDDGGFSHIKGEASTAMSTEQAIIALSSIKQNDNPYKMTRALSPPPQTKTDAIADVVQKHTLWIVGFGAALVILILVAVTVFRTRISRNKEKS
ncbi:MAG: prenyltransferase/squalene oxidase repeat-containing protein [Oscillospiraceae bacterium]